MISKKLFIKNQFGERLETIKEYKKGKNRYPAVLLVPGLAMDLHEWNQGFDEIAKVLVKNSFLVYRFSFAGCGNSDGDFCQMTIERQAKQVRNVISFILKDSLIDKQKIGILAQSMGGPSIIQALPLKIKSLIFFSSVFDPEKNLKKVLIKRKVFKPKGVSYLPRSNGTITPIGPQIWDDLKKLDLKEQLEKYTHFPVLVLHGSLDNKVPTEDVRKLFEYSQGQKEILIYPQGDHGLEKPPKVRQKALKKIVAWFKKTL